METPLRITLPEHRRGASIWCPDTKLQNYPGPGQEGPELLYPSVAESAGLRGSENRRAGAFDRVDDAAPHCVFHPGDQ